MQSMEQVGKKLDSMGWTLVNMKDPVDGSDVPSLDWRQVAGLMSDLGAKF